jgi:hypothetical protein
MRQQGNTRQEGASSVLSQVLESKGESADDGIAHPYFTHKQAVVVL